jgi:hypothetical protein
MSSDHTYPLGGPIPILSVDAGGHILVSNILWFSNQAHFPAVSVLDLTAHIEEVVRRVVREEIKLAAENQKVGGSGA